MTKSVSTDENPNATVCWRESAGFFYEKGIKDVICDEKNSAIGHFGDVPGREDVGGEGTNVAPGVPSGRNYKTSNSVSCPTIYE